MEELNRVSDETLIEEFKKGNRESFQVLVKRYQRQAVNYIYRLSRDFGLAEDIAQTAFLTVYQKAFLFNPIYKFRTWFYKILTNLYYYEMRNREHSSRTLIDIPHELLGAKSPRDELEKKEKKENIEKLINLLPHKQKTALVLYIYHDMSYRDIALTLGCSVGTVKSRIHYAIRELRYKIDNLREKNEM